METSKKWYVEESTANSFEKGLRKAHEAGFVLHEAIAKQHNLDEETTETYVDYVAGQAMVMAEEMRLKEEFFDSAAATMLLLAIAERWVMNELALADDMADKHLAYKDREMLVDAAMHLALDNSREVEEICQVNPEARERYYGKAEADQAFYETFLRAITNRELSQKINDMYHDDSSDSFLAEARELMNLMPDEERPFEVVVLNIEAGTSIETYMPHLAEYAAEAKPVQPDAGSYAEVAAKLRKTYLEEPGGYEEQQVVGGAAFVATCRANKIYYDNNFAGTHGELPGAWMRADADGKQTVYLYAAHAMALLHAKATYDLSLKHHGFDGLESVWNVATSIHEYGHADRSLLVSRVFGLGPEERKAEYVSHDKGGYLDVKQLYGNMGALSWPTPNVVLAESIRKKDASGAFVARIANEFGLKVMFLMMADAPASYRAGVHGDRYIDLTTQIENDKPDIPATIISIVLEQLHAEMDREAEEENRESDSMFVDWEEPLGLDDEAAFALKEEVTPQA